ncbi:MAG: Cys-Gln thioester bond-forming surface protein [Methylococcaceae bacterium]|nr:Cys-Gln thioester bond-forming surface protein [Methylococcaceae bacterium]
MKIYTLILALSISLFNGGAFSATIPFDASGRLTTGTTYAGGINLVLDGTTLNNEGGGNILNSMLDGKSLAYAYCIDLFHSISLNQTYNADYNNKALFDDRPELTEINGGKIAWLILNIAETAVEKYQQAGLQALIWEQVYGATRFTLNSSTSNQIKTAYQTYSAALGANTASVNDVLWISPYQSTTSRQDLVAWDGLSMNLQQAASVSTPETIWLFSIGLAGLVVSSCKKRGVVM